MTFFWYGGAPEAGLLGSGAFSATGSGGVTVAGSAPATFARAVAGTGGVTVAGTAPAAQAWTVTGAGGVVVAGSAPARQSWAVSGSGGVVVGGTAPATVARVVAGTGGIVVGGTALVAHSRAVAGAGGVVTSGVALARTLRVWTATGGVIVAGSAMPARGRVVVGSGGVLVGGTAPASFLPGGGPQNYPAIGTGGVRVGGTALVQTSILNYQQLGGRDYTGTGVVGDRDPGTALTGTVVERDGAAGAIVPQAEGAMGVRKAKPDRPHGGRNVVQHYLFKGRGPVTVGGSASASLIPSGAPLPPTAYEWVGTGGLAIGGSALVSRTAPQQFFGYAHGGVVVSGTAAASVNNLPLPVSRSYFGSGGVVVSGIAPVSSTLTTHYARVGTGGVRVSGSAVVSSSIKRKLIVIGGGLILVRGSAGSALFINNTGNIPFALPVAPATFDPSRNPAHFTSEVTATSAADLQNKIDTVPAGTRIRIPLGVDWTRTIFLRNRGFGPTQWIELAPDMAHAAFEAARPYGRRMNLGLSSSLGLPTLRNPAGNVPVIYTDPGASGYRLTGLNFRLGGDVTAMCRLGMPDMSNASQAGKRIIVDRCTAVGGTTYFCNRAFFVSAEQCAILGCHIADIYGSSDSQGVLIAGWQGPIMVLWNRIEGWSENINFGGFENDASTPASDVTIMYNYVTKNIAYRRNSPFGNVVKNLIESKSVRRARIRHNIFEYDWPDGQPYPAIFKSEDQSWGQHPEEGTLDFEFAYNWLRKVPGGFNLAAHPQGPQFVQPMRRVHLHNNLLEDVNNLPDYSGNGTQIQMLGGLADIGIEHNTFVKSIVGGVTAFSLDGIAVGPIAVRSNILRLDGYGVKRGGNASGRASWEAYIPNSAYRTWSANVDVAGATDIPGTILRASDAAVGYVDLAGGNYQVTGALATAGHDGLPVGIADYPAFMAELASVQNG